MDFSQDEEKLELEVKPSVLESSKHFSKSIIFTFIQTYGIFPINLVMTMIISRIVSQDIWGELIYAIVLIGGAKTVLVFLPPSLPAIFQYKLPELLLKKKMSELKGIVGYLLKIRIISAGLITIGYMLFAEIMMSLGSNSLIYKLILIISPIIFIDSIHEIFLNLFYLQKKFQTASLLIIQQRFIFLIGYIIIFLLKYDESKSIIFLAILNTIAYLAYLPKEIHEYFRFFRNIIPSKVDWNYLKSYLKFGLYYSISFAGNSLNAQIYSGVLNYYGIPRYNVYNNISINFTQQAQQGFVIPYGLILSDLENSNQREKMLFLLRKVYRFVNILICLLVGALYFLAEIYLLIIYPPEYLEIVALLQYFVFSIFFGNIMITFRNIYSIIGEEKRAMQLDLTIAFLMSVLAVVGMLFFSFNGLLLSKLLAFIIASFLFWGLDFFGFKKIRIPFKEIFLPIISLIGIILISAFLGNIVLNLLSISLKQWILNIISSLNILEGDLSSQVDILLKGIVYFAVFCVIYAGYIVFFRILTKEDIKQIEQFNLKIPLIKILFRIFKKVLRSEKHQR